jgi:hypothetical protein
MNDERAIEKIQLLLRKAESTTPEEAQALTEHAERLMVRYGIEQARIAAESGKPMSSEPIVERKVWFGGTYSNLEVDFRSWIVVAFGDIQTYRIMRRHTNQRALVVVGHESDVGRAMVIADSLRLQAATALEKWWSRIPGYERRSLSTGERTRLRRDFLASFASAASKRIKETRRQAVEEVKGTGTDLVLASRMTAVQQHMDGVGDLARARRRSYEGVGAGLEAGRKANIGGSEIEGGRRAIAGC